METTRQLKVARLLQKELSEIIQREGRNLFGNTLITITGVKVTPDLALARIHVSLFMAKDREALLAQIKSHTKELRKHLGLRVKNQLRIVPNLEFFIDDSLDYVENIERLLKK